MRINSLLFPGVYSDPCTVLSARVQESIMRPPARAISLLTRLNQSAIITSTSSIVVVGQGRVNNGDSPGDSNVVHARLARELCAAERAELFVALALALLLSEAGEIVDAGYGVGDGCLGAGLLVAGDPLRELATPAVFCGGVGMVSRPFFVSPSVPIPKGDMGKHGVSPTDGASVVSGSVEGIDGLVRSQGCVGVGDDLLYPVGEGEARADHLGLGGRGRSADSPAHGQQGNGGESSADHGAWLYWLKS